MKQCDKETVAHMEEVNEIKNAIQGLPEEVKKDFLDGINFYRAAIECFVGRSKS